MKTYSILLFAIVFALSCNKGQKPLEKPEISFRGISHQTIKNADDDDNLIINLIYTMATESLGTKDTATKVILVDSRDTVSNQQYPFPTEIYDNVPDPTQNNISGAITVIVPNNYFTLSPDKPNGDTLQFRVFLKDKDGIESNSVYTDSIYVVP